MKNSSIWLDFKRDFEYPKLEKDIFVDVVIIGGGITGISTLYQLRNSNLKVCLVEKNRICEGVTSRTTGKLTYLQDNIYSKLCDFHSREVAKKYLNSQRYAIKLARDIINQNNIECNLETADSYVFSNSNDGKIEKEVALLNELDIDVKLSNVLPNGVDVSSSYYVQDTYVFHPIKYLYALANICTNSGKKIYENTCVIDINKENDFYVVRGEKFNIKARYVVMAVHYPYFLFPFLMPFKAYLEKSYIEAFKVIKNYKFSAINLDKETISTRFHQGDGAIYQLYLTNSHNYCVKNNEEENFRSLLEEKDITPEYIWSNKDIITNDFLPFIGRINNDNLLLATGYNTWGMTNGILAGKILSDIIEGRDNEYFELFKPNRGLNLGGFVNFPISLWSSISAFLKSKVIKNKNWYSDRVRFEERNGKSVGIYIDEENKEHIVYNLCPHMKCSLIFNEIEKTWDCPCHGSRFSIDGKSIEGPSNYDITYKND